jgi:hypothetical protein
MIRNSSRGASGVSTRFPERNRLDVAAVFLETGWKVVCPRLRSIPFNPVQMHAGGQAFALGTRWLYVASPGCQSSSLVYTMRLRGVKALRLGRH